MPPPTLACPTCHKRFFKSSLAIHAKKCKAHFEKSHVNCPDCELTCSKELFRKHECDPGLKKRVKERRERERAQAKRAAEEKRKLEKATKKANQEANAVCGSCGLSKKVMMEEVEQEWRQRQKIKLQALLPSFQNNIAPTCDECETKKSVGFCVDCEQNMCQDCSERIHNKGARKRHRLISDPREVDPASSLQPLSPSSLSVPLSLSSNVTGGKAFTSSSMKKFDDMLNAALESKMSETIRTAADASSSCTGTADEGDTELRVSCKSCNRFFNADRIEIHQPICFKIKRNKRKRKTWNGPAKRIEGTVFAQPAGWAAKPEVSAMYNRVTQSKMSKDGKRPSSAEARRNRRSRWKQERKVLRHAIDIHKNTLFEQALLLKAGKITKEEIEAEQQKRSKQMMLEWSDPKIRREMEKYNQQGMDSMKAQTARAARIKARSATIKTKRESKKTHRQSSDKNRNQAKNRKSGADTQTKSNAQMFHSSKVSNQEQSKALSTSASSHRNITIASKTSNNNGSGSDNKENHSSNRLSSTSKSKLRTGSSVDKNGLRSSTNRNCNSSDGKSKRTKSLSHSASGSHISRSRHSLGNLSLNPLKTSGESGSGRVSSKEKKSYVKPSSSSNIKRRGLGQSNSRASLSSSSSKVDVLKFPVSRAGLLDDQLSSRRASKGNGSLNSKSRLPGQSVKPKGHDDPSKNTYFASAGSNLKLGITDPKQMSASTNNKVMEDYILREKRRRVSRSQSSASLRSSRRGSSTSTSVSSTPSKKVGTNSGPKAGKSKKKGPSEALLKRLTNKTYTKASSSSSTSFASSSASSSASAVTSSKPKKLASSASVSVLMSGGKIQRNMSLSKEHTEVAQHRADFYERLLKK